MLYSGPRYWLSYKGSVCSDQGASLVTDRGDCRTAFSVIQDEHPNTQENIAYNGNWGNHPKGCFLYTPNNNIYFNSHSTGSEHSDDHQICKWNGK